ncbi:RNA polymerase sigma factor [Arthrobacter alkaliphilus]|uniref:RNA polymerase sigma factor n=1 Tax=Arthrobacter alkaliphilus TaxID=369936 RepID=UPI001F457EA9|nr:sigma-70 family RNA polymerase sigma factor [Arthrobacter alkaliphilus]
MTEGTGLAQADPDALFIEAYRVYSPGVCGYLRTRGVEDPESVTQDVFLALYPRLGDLRGGPAGLRTLIFTIAHARAVDSQRSRVRTPASIEYDPARDPRLTESAEDEALDTMADGLALLESLPDDYREVLALRVIAELSLESTARIMNKSQGAIKQLQRRALGRLKEARQETKDQGKS